MKNNLPIVYCLNRDVALSLALEHKFKATVYEDTHFVYYDGELLDEEPINLIHVPISGFSEFFANSTFPIPTQLLGDQNKPISDDRKCQFEETIKEIADIRKRLTDLRLGNLHEDCYFMDSKIAWLTALQQNRVYLDHPSIDGLQVCYYDGEPINNAPNNLIHAPSDQLLDILVQTRFRLPKNIKVANHVNVKEAKSLSKTFSQLLDQVEIIRNKTCVELMNYSLRKSPDSFNLKSLKIAFISSRMTEVMQYCANGLIKAFTNLGHECFHIIEQNDMEGLSSAWRMAEFIEFDPNVVVNINHVQNSWLNENVYNIVWFQDLMNELTAHEQYRKRERDFFYSLSPEYDEHLKICGASNISRRFIGIDENTFKLRPSIKRENKAVFIGSEYRSTLNPAPPCIDQILEEFKQAIQLGKSPDRELAITIAEKYDVEFKYVWPRAAACAVRDTAVEWLCTNKELDVEVYGRGWENNPIVAPFHKGTLTHGEDVAKIYNAAKYALATLNLEIKSQRLSEISACGSIPVVFDFRYCSEAPLWDNECLFFYSEEELHQCLIQTPLGDPQDIAKSNTYTDMATHILKQISQHSEQNNSSISVTTGTHS